VVTGFCLAAMALRFCLGLRPAEMDHEDGSIEISA